MYVDLELLRRLDDATRTTFQGARDLYFRWLLISTGLVFSGILLEGPEIIQETREWLRSIFPPRLVLNPSTGLPIVEHSHFAWIPAVSLMGWILVFIGVIGEGAFEGLMSKADEQLQTLNDTLLANASERAGEANREASRANGRASKNEADALVTRASLVSAQTSLENLKGKNLELATKLAEAEKGAFPRALRQQSEVAKRLEQYQGTRFSIRTIPDFEARRTAEIISSTLRMAKWTFDSFLVELNAPIERFFFPGVFIEIGDAIEANQSFQEVMRVSDENRRLYFIARGLEKELTDGGIKASFRGPSPNPPPDSIRVVVSLKPMPNEPIGNLVIQRLP